MLKNHIFTVYMLFVLIMIEKIIDIGSFFGFNLLEYYQLKNELNTQKYIIEKRFNKRQINQ